MCPLRRFFRWLRRRRRQVIVMSNIFTLPVITRDPGDKLYFFATGTSTPQNTYSDAGLTTPHDNPVEADAGGEFPVIYMDPSLPAYRVRLTDSNDVQVWQKDNVIATGTESTAYRIKDDLPQLIFEETDAATDEGKWKIKSSGGVLTMSLLDDAEATETPFLTVTRTGDALVSVEVSGATVTATGSFTGTQTGYASDLTPTIQWRRSGSKVTLSCEVGSLQTSNQNGMTLAGIPVAIRPAQTLKYITRLTDNGTIVVGVASVSTGGTITFGNGITDGTFTSSGNKGLPSGWQLEYETA